MLETVEERPQVGDGHGEGETGEHRLVVRRIPAEEAVREDIAEASAMNLLQVVLDPGELVELPAPAVDVDARYAATHPFFAGDPADSVDGRGIQGRHVLAIVDGEVGVAELLIRRDGRAGHFPEHPLAYAVEGPGVARQTLPYCVRLNARAT